MYLSNCFSEERKPQDGVKSGVGVGLEALGAIKKLGIV